jgi:hypothetical protein
MVKKGDVNYSNTLYKNIFNFKGNIEAIKNPPKRKTVRRILLIYFRSTSKFFYSEYASYS